MAAYETPPNPVARPRSLNPSLGLSAVPRAMSLQDALQEKKREKKLARSEHASRAGSVE